MMKSGLKICVVQPPSFGYKQHELMSDIAVSVGATYFSEKTGDDLSLMKMEDLGYCQKVVVGRDTTVIIKDEEDSEEVVERPGHGIFFTTLLLKLTLVRPLRSSF